MANRPLRTAQRRAKAELHASISRIQDTCPAGYGASAKVFHSGGQEEERQALAAIAAAVLDDPLATYQLSERVFELLQEDIKYQHERCRDYGRR